MKIFNLALLVAVVAGVRLQDTTGESAPAPPQITVDEATGNRIVTHDDGTVVTIASSGSKDL